MVSDFICEEMGTLGLTDEAKKKNEARPAEQRLPEKARVIIAPSGKAGEDSYWNMDQMIPHACTPILFHFLMH